MTKKQYISYQELKEKIESIPDLNHKNFIKLTYACLGRVGEVTRSNPRCNPNPPISGHQLKATDEHLVIEVLTEKTNKLRRVPINRSLEPWLTEPLIRLAELVPGYLFPFSTRWGEMLFLKYFDTENIHLLRGWRATHLLQGVCTRKRLRTEQVMLMGGWTDSRSLHNHYSGVIIEDYQDMV